MYYTYTCILRVNILITYYCCLSGSNEHHLTICGNNEALYVTCTGTDLMYLHVDFIK